MPSEKPSPPFLSPLPSSQALCRTTMSNEANSSPDREDSPHSSPTDLITLARQHFRHRWSTTTPRDSDGDEEYQLRWEGHGSQLTNMVTSLENNQASSDVTVVTKGASIPSHRLVLAAASPFFCQILQGLPTSQHPVIVIKTADPRHLRYLVSFCYTGTVTLHAHDLQQVLQLAEDLEIRGLKITLAEGRSSPSLATLAALHPRLFPPSSPNTRFPFTQHLHRPSSATPTPLGYSDVHAKLKRNMSPSDYSEGQGKRMKVEPIAMDGDRRPHSNPSPYYIPPASAPPILSSALFFKGAPGSPPNSAPPQSFGESFPLQSSHTATDDNKDQGSPGLSIVPPSRLLQPSSRSSSRPPSPLQDTVSRSQSPAVIASQIPAPMNRSGREPSTPTTPTTPSTPPAKESGSIGVLGGSSGSRVLLWRFLLDLLHNPRYMPMYIRWLNRADGVFRIMESDMVAQLWGMARKNQKMNYEKMSRGMRTYYKRGILFHIDGTKLIYRFNTKDPEIEQRMQYYDMMKASSEGEVSSEQTSILPSSTLAPPSTSPVTSSPTATLENIYSNPLFREMAQLPHSLLYEPYISYFRNASKSELY